MSNGIYAAAAGMAAQQTQLNAIANDIANADTTGYKSERVAFVDLLPSEEQGISIGGGATAVDAGFTTGQGSLEASDNPIAVAINGPGFIAVRTSAGTTGLTRDGNLQIDANGSLVTASGERLQPPITLPKGTQPSAVTIASNGSVSVAGKQVGRIQLLDVPSPGGLLAAGANTYVASSASGSATPVSGSTLQQGQLEQSNVNVAQEMSDMVEAQNNYSILSKVISTQDQMGQIANQMRQ